MIGRLTFLGIAAFWVTMNVLLWRAAYGAHGRETPVAPELVWHKILTAPDTSALTLYQDGARVGFCELSTSVEQAMESLDANDVPPAGLIERNGFQIHFNGNVSLGSITNRLRFDGHLQFYASRRWRELDLKLFTRLATVAIHSTASNQIVHLNISSDQLTFKRDFTFDQLQNPTALVGAIAGGLGPSWFAGLDWSAVSALPLTSVASPTALAGTVQWEAHSDRLKVGQEPVDVFRLETRVLDEPVVLYVSRAGEILRVELPGGLTASLDAWNKL